MRVGPEDNFQGYIWDIQIDGKEPEVVMAWDTEEGWADVITRDEKGHPALDEDGELILERVYGTVTAKRARRQPMCNAAS